MECPPTGLDLCQTGRRGAAPYRVCTNIGKGHPVLRRWRRLPQSGNSYPPALTQSYSFHSVIRVFISSFSFEQVGTKEKEAKRKCQKGTRKGGFLKKAPFKSRKNFSATAAGMSGGAPKVTYQPISRTARCPRKTFTQRTPCFRCVRPKQRVSRSAPVEDGVRRWIRTSAKSLPPAPRKPAPPGRSARRRRTHRPFPQC